MVTVILSIGMLILSVVKALPFYVAGLFISGVLFLNSEYMGSLGYLIGGAAVLLLSFADLALEKRGFSG